MQKNQPREVTNSNDGPIDEVFTLDAIDRKILNILQKDNQITNIALAEKVHLSAPPCFRRVKRLRDMGVIVKDVSLVDPFKVGQGMAKRSINKPRKI